MKPRAFFVATLIGAASLRILLVFLTPALFAADEAGHLLYLHEIAIHHVLPIQTLDGIWANNNGAEDFYHTPLYYLLLSPVYRVLWPSHAALYVLRLVSVGFGLVTVAVVRDIVREHFPELPWAAELAAVFAAFQPVFLAVTSAVNNDSLSLLLMALVLQRLGRVMRDGLTVARVVVLCGLLSVAMYVKVSALVLFPAFVVALPFVRPTRRWGRVGLLAPPVGALIAILPWWVFRNQPAYGSLLALDLNWAVLAGPTWARAAKETLYMLLTFWFSLGRSTEIVNPLWVAVPLWALIYVCGRRVFARWRSMKRSQQGLLLVSLAPLVAGFAQSVSYGIKWGFAQGRYLLPGLTVLAIIFGLSFGRSAVPELPRKRAVAAGVLAVAAWLLFLGTMVLPGFARVRVDRSVGSLTQLALFHTGDLDSWVMQRSAPTRAEDACTSATSSRFSRPC